MPETPLTTPREPVDTVLPRTPWWAVATSVAALVAFAAAYLYAASRTPGFDVVRTSVSDLGASGTPGRNALGIGLLVVGALLIVTALGLEPADPAGRWTLAFGGLGLWLLASAPAEPATYTLRHTFSSEIAFVLLALWPAFGARAGTVVWPLRRRVGVIVSVLTFVAMQIALWGIILRATTDGIRELAVYGWVVLWPVIVTVWTAVRDPGVATRFVDPPPDPLPHL